MLETERGDELEQSGVELELELGDGGVGLGDGLTIEGPEFRLEFNSLLLVVPEDGGEEHEPHETIKDKKIK